MTNSTQITRDEECPQCEFPETYVTINQELPPEQNPRSVGCRKCGWAYSPMSQILNPYTFDPIDFPDVTLIDNFSMAYILTAPELGEDEPMSVWEDAVQRRWQEYAQSHSEYWATAWDEGAEHAWQKSGEGFNGEYANGRSHDGAFSFEQLNPGENPYR